MNPEPGCYHPERGTQAESVAVITAPCALSSLPSFINDAIPACGRVGVYLVCPVDRCVSQYDNHVSLSRLEMKRRVHRGSGVRWVQPVRGHRYIVVFERGREDGRTGNILWKKCLITKSPGVEGGCGVVSPSFHLTFPISIDHFHNVIIFNAIMFFRPSNN